MLKVAAGGLPAVLGAMRFSQDPVIQGFLEKYDTISVLDRRYLPWEAIALAAGLSPTYLLGSCLVALQQHSVNTVKVIALSNHPDITRQRVKFAKMIGGHRDRDALDTALGFLPTNKGTTFNINPLSIGAKGEGGEDDAPALVEGDVDHLFPSVNQMQDKVRPIRAGLLGAGE